MIFNSATLNFEITLFTTYMKALILENSRLYRQLLDDILGQEGFENDITDEIKIAEVLLKENSFDLICLNENLKDGSGIKLAHYLKQHKEYKTIPILFFTSDTEIQTKINLPEIEGVIYKHNLKQVSDQIIHFLETHLDPVFTEGRILFIEDSKSISQLILTALNHQNFSVEHFTSADEAWKEFTDVTAYGSDLKAYDLILTDINVEGNLNGLEFTRLVRKLDDARGFIPIIAVTSQTDSDLRLSLFQEGISDFIPKPILIEELLVRVKNLISNKRLLDKVHDQRRELYSLATTDKLTGCHNRHSLTEFSKKFISQAIRHKFHISLMVMDLDFFKKINDTHGHATGDIVLKEMGALLNKSFRDGDLVARFGGEEFIVLLNHCNKEFALKKAEKLRQDVFDLKPNELQISISIGVTTLEIGTQFNFEALFAAADQGVYKAKDNGRNQVQFISPKTK